MHEFAAFQLERAKAEHARYVAFGFRAKFPEVVCARIEHLRLDYPPSPEVEEAIRVLTAFYETLPRAEEQTLFSEEELRVIDEEFERSQQRRAEREGSDRPATPPWCG